MANGIAPRFLQSSAQKRGQRGLQGFRLRTGQRFPDIARGQFLEQQLEADLAGEQQRAQVGLQFRQQEEQERQARVREGEREQARVAARRERKREEEFDPIKTAATIVSSFT